MNETKTTCEYDPILKKVTVRNASAFPQEAYAYVAEAEILDLSFGHLTDLPADLTRFQKLRVGFFSYNDFETIPDVIAACEQLEMVGFRECKLQSIQPDAFPKKIKAIILTGNQIKQLPSSIGDYSELKKIMLAGNLLTEIHEAILNCKNLELLRVPMNKLEKFPDWLFKLPKLGWYNDGANPFHANDRTHFDSVKSVSWNSIKIGEKLGQSSSNEVFRGSLEDGSEVAVKLFGGELTTDGLAIDDINACLLVGEHNHIIGGIYKVTDAPDGKHGLVMPLIPNTFTRLAKQPSFTTFTRDAFPGEPTFTVPFITNVLKDICAAMNHCHQKGVMHGDLYAHNILSNETGNSFLGDFGAATIYEPGSSYGKLRELVDVKSFGYLMDDLLQHCAEVHTALESLRDKCLDEDLQERPTFKEIEQLI